LAAAVLSGCLLAPSPLLVRIPGWVDGTLGVAATAADASVIFLVAKCGRVPAATAAGISHVPAAATAIRGRWPGVVVVASTYVAAFIIVAVPCQHVGVEWEAAVSYAADSNAVIVPVAEFCGSPVATVSGITDGVAAASAVLGLRPGAAVRRTLSVAAATSDAGISIDGPASRLPRGRTSLAAAVVSAAATGAAISV
jgi:hypothetical protein